MKERRRSYRVELDDETRIEATILAEGRNPVVARLLNVSTDGVAVRLDPPGEAFLPVGHTVEIVFQGERFAKPLTTVASVVHRLEEPEGARYGHEFTNKRGLDESLVAQALHTLFNRRRAHRVEPDPVSPIEVILTGGSAKAQMPGRMGDLSVTGMSVLTSREAETAFAGTNRLEAIFHLPGRQEPLRLECRVRHRCIFGTDVRYGLEFDTTRTESFGACLALIQGYVRDRQQQILRRAAP